MPEVILQPLSRTKEGESSGCDSREDNEMVPQDKRVSGSLRGTGEMTCEQQTRETIEVSRQS